MRKLMLACALALSPAAARGQVVDTARAGRDTLGSLPHHVAELVAHRYNAPAALRATGPATVAAGEVVAGDVAVLHGPLDLRGRVEGSVVVVNGDVSLGASSRIEGDLVVVGGTLRSEEGASVGGTTRVYRERLGYRLEGTLIVPVADASARERWTGWLRRRADKGTSRFRLLSARTYNRVEGLPILVGPSLRDEGELGAIEIDAWGIVRTAEGLRWEPEDIGHTLRADLRLGRGRGLIAGGRLYDVVAPVQDWEMSDAEIGLASFFLHRDFRDYFDRHGGSGTLGVHAGRGARLTLEYAAERWSSRDARDPWTLFRNGQAWRPNPVVDDGFVHLATATLQLDTRNDVEDPWSGWFATAELESGRGDFHALGPADPVARVATAPATAHWRRAFLDLRRYNRLSPDGQLNVRLLAGGWVGGDELPLQRRFALGGPGSLPGFDFRSGEDAERLMCTSGASLPGAPGQCERALLAQIEYRGDVELGSLLGARDPASWGLQADARWILFADAGRGWLVGAREGTVRYPSSRLPPLSTFQTDIGAGLDLGVIAVFVAKALSDADEPLNVFVRVRHRF